MKIVQRAVNESDRRRLMDAGLHPLLARLYAARRIRNAQELALDFAQLIPPSALKGADEAAMLLADAVIHQKKLLIIADYDADGATACAVGIRALRSFGARVEYLVPDRAKLGYGLSPELVDIAAQMQPDLLITVDNGIASVEGVAHARRLGIGTPGEIDAAAGVVMLAANVPGFGGRVELGPLLSAALGGVEIILDNDVRVAVLGEHTRGAGRPFRNMLGVWVGTGVGGGLILDGELHDGRGAAGEIGHTVVRPGGRTCSCGRKGWTNPLPLAEGLVLCRSRRPAVLRTR